MVEAVKTMAGPDVRPARPISPPVLVVDDDPNFLLSASVTLRSAGIEPVRTISDSRGVLPLLAGAEVAVVVLDLRMPHLPGTELLLKIREEHPQIPVIVITGMLEVDTAMDCMKAGAFEYLVKPVESGQFVFSVRHALKVRELQGEVSSLKNQLLSPLVEETIDFHGITTRNRKVQAIFRYAEAVALTTHPVLITGETGAGKELIARAIHALSRRAGEFVAVNVAGLDDTMFSDTLFGHRKGAFTGAYEHREGLLARAGGGTLFLDEIGDLEPRSQVKLLRLIEEKEYYPLGTDAPQMTDARILCATHRCLPGLLSAGEFRRDLFYRLQAHHVHLPPLRERMDDLPMLVDHYLEEAAQSLGRKKPTPPPELLKLLSAYHFPGNVRELRSMMFDAVTRHRSGILSLESFRSHIEKNRPDIAGPAPVPDLAAADAPLRIPERFPTLKEAVDYLVAEALKRSGNNQGVAALLLGTTREALNKRLARRKRLAAGEKATTDAA